ncbi:MAG: DNA alkylation repair protein [Flavobacteriales bacterium]|nr:DNA alkylation repair protein [Flavobacteriales bacterium]
MAEALKNVYSKEFVTNFLKCWSEINLSINQQEFISFVFDKDWEALELKARMSRLSDAMALVLPNNFEQAVPIFYKLIEILEKDDFPNRGYEYMFLPDYVEKFGRKHLDLSLELLARITQFVTSEFAIRPFIIDSEERVMAQLLKWSKSSDTDIRRLSSETCRSRLPWAMALPRFKKDASLIIPILENLKNDDSLYVRKSVANNLNDISKDHPDLALELAFKWHGKNENSDWIVKHGMRTLLKAGHPKSMELFDYANVDLLKLTNYQLLTPHVDFGKEAKFKFSISNITKDELKIRLEFAVYFMKNNGVQTKKVFKISERTLEPKQQLDFTKHHPLKPISTRKYYAGEHGIALIVNGIEFDKQSFLLNM